MNFTVEWTRQAEDALTEVWLAAPDRAAVTRAAHTIEQRLRSDPDTVGESRSENRRIVFEEPLGAIFRVDAANQLVLVVWTWRSRPPRPTA